MLVKIVHPGGHVELHDRPVLAAEIMLRNPKCVVAHPYVFQQPWAIVAPDTMLMLGQKFYVVPISTIRKLQRKSFKSCPSPVHDIQVDKTPKANEKDDNISSTCWSFMNKNVMVPCCCLHQSDKEDEGTNTASVRNTITDDSKGEVFSSNENCFLCLLNVIKIKANCGDKSEETKSSSTFGSSEIKALTRKRNKDFTRGSPKRFTSLDHWQPNLEGIVEEKKQLAI